MDIMPCLEDIVHRFFPSIRIPLIERVAEGMSTHVYRMVVENETFYLRILPELGASFAPEVAAHNWLLQHGVKVPHILYFEHCNEELQRSLMLTSEIAGKPLSRSGELSFVEAQAVVRAAGRDLALINSMPVNGFGWVTRDQLDLDPTHVAGQCPTCSSFWLEFWERDLSFLKANLLSLVEVRQLEQIVSGYSSWLEEEQGYLAHGDFDTTHIYHANGQYTGIIDFGEIRGADCWYDAGYFYLHDGETLPFQLTEALISGYSEITPLPADFMLRICFASLLINVRALARALQKQFINDHYIKRKSTVLRTDIAALHKWLE